MKILLINPGEYLPKKLSFPLNAFQPLGIAYIADVLKKKGYSVYILDILAEGFDNETIQGKYRYVGLPEKVVVKKLVEMKPDLVGITVPFTSQKKAGHSLASLVKKTLPYSIVVFGGCYPTTYASEILSKDKNIDYVIRGEGEITLSELVDCLGGKKKNLARLKKINGLVFRNKRMVITNPLRTPIENLDDYKVAWDLLPMGKYFEAARKLKSSRSISTFGKRWATIYTSRGCPFSCTFCVGHQVMGRKWRPRTVENVIQEMDYLIKNYQIKHFDIEDDNFSLDKERAKKICQRIIEKKWQIEWSTPNGIRADTVDEELIKKMKQSGCVRTIVAPESGDQWVVDNLMKKNLKLKKIKQVVKWCRKYRLPVDAFFIIGMPGEKRNNILKTIEFAKNIKKMGVDECCFGVVIPHKGTEIYKIVNENNWWRKDIKRIDIIEGFMFGEPMIESPFLSAEETKTLYKQAIAVNSLIPFYRFKLAIKMAIEDPRRFIHLAISDIQKKLGFKEGILGT